VFGLLRDAGSAAIDFVLVGILITLLFLGLLQLGFDLHLRNVLAAAAADGARYGANADRTAADGAAMANSLISAAVGSRYAHAVAVPGSSIDGQPVVTIRVDADLPLLVSFLPVLHVRVDGQALAEPR
jgi:Flp pilus assembly protein TadG